MDISTTPTAIAIAVALLAAGGPARAASGDLDETFGAEGSAVAPFGNSAATALVRQSDGKLVAAGSARTETGEVLAVARFDANGVLDPSFGGDGLVTTDVGAFAESAAQVLLQTDGKIVVVGTTATDAEGDDADILVVRYEADGDLDAGFGTGGVVVTSLGTAIDFAHAGALQADDRIIVVGGSASTETTSADLFVLRYENDGDLDATFGTGGLVTLDFGGRGDQGVAVVVQADGYIVVAGSSFDGPLFADGAVATLSRLDGSGALDAGFGTGGSAILAVDTINVFHSLVLQPDNKIVVLGATGPLNVSFHLFRYDSSGNLDGGFTGDPIPLFVQNVLPGSLARQPDGKFLVTGGGTIPFKVARMDSDGTLDTGFGMGGSIFVAVGTQSASVVTVAEPSGDIILGGFSRPVGSERSDYEITLARLSGSNTACILDTDCGPCERCGGGSVCEIGPRSGCTDATSQRAQLKFRQRYGKGDSLTLRWRGTVPSFDPTTTDDLALCLFNNGKRVLKAVAPAGGLCDGLPCWTSAGSGLFAYDDRDETPHGIRRIKIESDSLKLKAQGEELAASPQGLPDPVFLGPLGPPVLLQLHAKNGACMEATFDGDRRISAVRFKSKND